MKILAFIPVCCAFALFGQHPTRTFNAFSTHNNTVEITTNEGTYYLSTLNPNTIETTFVPTGQTRIDSSHAVLAHQALPFKNIVDKQEESLTLYTQGITVQIQKKPFQISYWYNGDMITSEKRGYYKNDTHEALEFNLSPTEMLYGGGARALGMNRRGNRLELYNKAHYGYEDQSKLMNFTLPIVFSSKKYFIHFDNAPIGFLDLDEQHTNTLTYETISGRKTYQIIVADTWQQIISNYTALTGRQPLPPRWAFGNFASRFGYHSEAETRYTVNKYAEDSIPLDAVILDLYWFGKEIQGTMGNLRFYTDSFPTPQQMIADFSRKKVKTVLITEPFILTTSSRWDEAVSKKLLATDSLGNPFVYNFYFGNTGLLDIYTPHTRAWFWNIYSDLISSGVKGFWGDLGEPEVHPAALRHATGTANEKHNIYGHDWARLIHNGYAAHLPHQRPFILMRAGAAGSQRFGMVPWSGDVNRSWGGLHPQPEIALQMGMQGMAYMHSDLGGFAGANDDRELYIRWLQYGVFQPIFRPHAQEQVASEPVFKDPNTKRIVRKAIQLRYDLLPYNYSIAYENTMKGTPLMRPLFFEEPNNPAFYEEKGTYLWGKDLLVAPVMNSQQATQRVVFPAANGWFDFYTDKKYSGGTTEEVPLTLESIPVFARAGAFIPMASKLQNTDDYHSDSLTVHFYFDKTVKTSTGTLYEDDGNTAIYQNTSKHLLSMEYSAMRKVSSVRFTSTYDDGVAQRQNHYAFVLHNIDKQPKKIWYNKQQIPVVYDPATKTLRFALVVQEGNSMLQWTW